MAKKSSSRSSARTKITPKVRREIYEKFNRKCCMCGCITYFDKKHMQKNIETIRVYDPNGQEIIDFPQSELLKFARNRIAEVDHIEPVSRGGSDDYDNLRLLCHECNVAKSNNSDKEYQAKKCYEEIFEDVLRRLAEITNKPVGLWSNWSYRCNLKEAYGNLYPASLHERSKWLVDMLEMITHEPIDIFKYRDEMIERLGDNRPMMKFTYKVSEEI
jgi:5-methylcytosine-specific restriction endonuclease McrA